MKKTIGQTIADQRKAQGMTQKDLADKMNVTDKAVSKWERDLSIPDIASIPKLAGILQISVEELLTSTEEPAAEPQWKNILHIILKTVPLAMGVNPVFAVVSGLAVGGYGILPGFIAGYLTGLIAPMLEQKLPEGLNVILGALVTAPLARFLAITVDPAVNLVLGEIGSAISAAAEQSPLVMGFLLGGIMKMICTSPLSSMALTAMLGLTGLPMGIAAIACVGGSFTNGIIFHKLGFGNKGNVIAVMLEPLTQANIITANPIPIFSSNFIGGGLAGISAAVFGIVNNAPGTASPIPGLLAPFAFNAPLNVVLALAFAILGGCAAGLLGGMIFGKTTVAEKASTSGIHPEALPA